MRPTEVSWRDLAECCSDLGEPELMSASEMNTDPTSTVAAGNTHKPPKFDRLYPYLLIAPTMITLVLVALVPFLFAVYLSLHEMRYVRVGDLNWFANYGTLLTDEVFWNSMWVTFIFVMIAVPIEFMLGLVGAVVLDQKIYFRSTIIPLLFIPTMLAPIVVAIIWKIMLAGSWGLLSYNILERFGILSDTSAFASPDLALFALIFVDIWQWTPFMTLAFFAGLQALPQNPYHAAAVDGASKIQIFFKITLPLMTPLLAVIGLLRLIDAFKVFDSIFILTGGGPGSVTDVASLRAYKLVFEQWNTGPAFAMVVVIWIMFFIFCNIFYQLAQKKLKAF